MSKFKHCSVTSDSDLINENFINHTRAVMMFENEPKSTIPDGVFSPDMLITKEPPVETPAEQTMRTLENV
jgi:hypothetical protein